MNRNTLKYMAIVAMLLDHIAHAFIPNGTLLYVLFRTVSRITAPLMCYFIVEGYFHTRNVKKYVMRLFLFSIVSLFPFAYFVNGQWLPLLLMRGRVSAGEAWLYLPFADKTLVFCGISVITTLCIALLIVWMWDKARFGRAIKILLTVLACLAVDICDWSYWCICYCLVFYFLREKPMEKWLVYSAVSLMYIFNVGNFFNVLALQLMPTGLFLYRAGVFFVIPLLERCYNGEPGRKNAVNQWFFYLFYPAHLLILDVILLLTR